MYFLVVIKIFSLFFICIRTSLAMEENDVEHWPCGQHWDRLGAHFNLEPLMLHGEGINYHVKDIHDIPERNFTYVFNICSDVGHLPNPNCLKPKDPEGGLAPAYQVSENNCYRLAGHLITDANWHLIDENDPTIGIELEYTGGEFCKSVKAYRSLTLRFICTAELGLPSFETERIRENKCQYSVDIETMFGCPTECQIGPNRELCSKNGFCGFDTDSRRPRCFCNSGWRLDDCSEKIPVPPKNITTVGAFLIVISVFLFGLLISGLYVYWKVRKLRRLNEKHQEEISLFSIEDNYD